MYELGVVHRNIRRADATIAERLGGFGSATVHEAMGRVGLMQPYMRPIYAGAQAAGTAVTVLLHPGDNWMMHVVAEQIQPGDVVVVVPHLSSTADEVELIVSGRRLTSGWKQWLCAHTGSSGVKASSMHTHTLGQKLGRPLWVLVSQKCGSRKANV